MFVGAAIAVVLLVPLVMLVIKRTPPHVAATEAPATTFDQDIALARSLLDTGKAPESLAPLERAQRANPNAFAVYNNQCVAYGILEQRAEAVAACKRALEIDPSNQLGKNNLVWVEGIKPGAKP